MQCKGGVASRHRQMVRYLSPYIQFVDMDPVYPICCIYITKTRGGTLFSS